MTDFLNEQSCELEEYDEQLVRRLIEKVTVFDDKLTVEFKSGVEIDIEIQDIRNGDQMRGVTSLIGGFSYLRIDFDCEYTYNNINNVVDIIQTVDKVPSVCSGFSHIRSCLHPNVF